MLDDSTDSRLKASDGPVVIGPSVVQKLTSGDFSNPSLAYPMLNSNRVAGGRPFRGYCLLINQRDFSPSTGQTRRDGTDVDADSVERLFKRLSYKVQRHLNVDRRTMMRILNEVALMDHSQCDSFICCVLSHGENGVIYASDGVIPTDSIMSSFRGNRAVSLAGKPKFFVFQACRGIQFDKGISLVTDSADEVLITKIPVEADILVAYSTVPGYYAWRNSLNGSWFIQELCRIFEEDAKREQAHDVISLLTLVARCVAYKYRSNTGMEGSHNMVQMSNFTSTLTMLMYLTGKPSSG